MGTITQDEYTRIMNDYDLFVDIEESSGRVAELRAYDSSYYGLTFARCFATGGGKKTDKFDQLAFDLAAEAGIPFADVVAELNGVIEFWSRGF